MEKINCPICGSKKINLFCNKNNYTLYNCKDCEAGFVWPMPDNLDEIYGENYFKAGSESKDHGYTDYDQDKEPMKEVFNKYLKKFEQLTNGRKIFDVGAATGYFLDLAKKRGWQTSGIEISKYAANEARSRGHSISHCSLLDFGSEDKFDVITMWDVLEHLDKPKAYIEKVNNLLNDEGLLAINTIDRGSWWARIMGKRWHLIVPPEHLFYFSKKSLKKILEDNGFEIIEIKKVGKKFSLAYIFKILYNWQRLKIWENLSYFFNKKLFRKLCISINLRDNILIIAKK